jgi:hypothetical protein
MGVVYRARDLTLGRTVALKVLAGPVAKPGAARRFHREAEVLAQLTHANIVTLYEARLLAGRPYFAMQFVRGGSLAEQLPRFREVPRAAAALVEQVARAVHHAHTQGVLHRDLKPANILLDEAGKPWVSDFGLAKLLTAPDASSDSEGEAPAPAVNGVVSAESLVTHPGGLPGTPAYMAPEQLTGAGDPASPAPDVWALGVVLYELLTGQRPFTGQTREELWEQIRHGVPAPPRKLAPGLDRRLERIVLRCLEKEPGRRYPSAAALADALAAYRTRRPLWRRAALVGMTVAALVFAGFMALAGREERETDPYQHFLRATAPLLQRLERGEAVDLVVPGYASPYFVRAGEGGTKVIPVPEGLSFFSTAFGIVELLPAVPRTSYRMVVEMRHEECQNPKYCMTGPFCRGAHVATGPAENHLFQLVWLNDRITIPVAFPNQGVKEQHSAWLKYFFIRFDDAPRPNGLPYWVSIFERDALKSRVLYPPRPPEIPSPWRKVVLDVDEQQTAVSLNFPSAQGDETTLEPLRAADWRFLLGKLRNPPPGAVGVPELNVVDDRQFEPKTLGVCVSCGRCVVRRLRIEPWAPNGR